MKVFPETRRVDYIWYLRLYYYYFSIYTLPHDMISIVL
jgi:outer membrane protein assembly factor BamD (BamD/ComL family)